MYAGSIRDGGVVVVVVVVVVAAAAAVDMMVRCVSEWVGG
jgi:hypothetical protein